LFVLQLFVCKEDIPSIATKKKTEAKAEKADLRRQRCDFKERLR